MARIPDQVIERLKQEIPLDRLAAAHGVKLKQHGAALLTPLARSAVERRPARCCASLPFLRGLSGAQQPSMHSDCFAIREPPKR